MIETPGLLFKKLKQEILMVRDVHYLALLRLFFRVEKVLRKLVS